MTRFWLHYGDGKATPQHGKQTRLPQTEGAYCRSFKQMIRCHLRQARQRDVPLNRMIEHQPLRVPVFGHKRDAAVDCLRCSTRRPGAPFEFQRAALDRPQTENRLEDFRSPAADQARESVANIWAPCA